MNQERQDVADQQTFAKGDPEHLILAQTKAMSDPLDVRLMPEQDGAGLLRLLGFLAHTSILPSTSLRRPFHLLLPSRRPELAPLLQMLPLLKLLLPEVAAHHRVAVLVNAIGEVLAGFQEKSLNPLYVHTMTLIPPIPLRSRAQQKLPERGHLLPAHAMQLLPELFCSVPAQVNTCLE